MNEKKSITVAVSNVQLGASVTKGYWQYIFLFWKYFLSRSQKPIVRMAHFFKKNNVDILFCTEILSSSFRSGFSSQVDTIAFGADFPYTEFFGIDDGGNAIFSKFPILKKDSFLLSSGKMKRMLGHTIITVGEKELHLCVAHLSLNASFRIVQMKQIADIIKSLNGPIILAGDFNAKDDTLVYFEQNTKLKNCGDIKTFPSWNPKYSLDKIFISDDLVCSFVFADASVLFSDHLPLIAKIEIM